MDFLNKGECYFCGIIIRDENVEEINDVIKEKLGILLMKLTFVKEVHYVTCKVCCAKLFAAFNFKSTCLHTNNTIIPYVDFESSRQIYLKEIYKKKESKQGNSMLKNQEICRLCLLPTDGKHKSTQDVPSKTFEIYIPEIKFAETTDPAICLKCIDALCIHTTFIQSCLDVEKTRNMNEVGDILLTNGCIKTEETEIKSEETVENEPHFKIPYLDITKVDNEEWDLSGRSAGSLMDIEEAKIQYDLNNLDQSTISVHSAEITHKECKYKTKDTSEEQSDYKDEVASQLLMFNCDECSYKAKHKYQLKNHMLRHRDPSQVQMYKCDKCTFETKHRRSLLLHDVSHKDPSEVQVYKCDTCKFETKYRKSLRQHQLRHKDPSDVKMYMCGECDYRSTKNCNLKNHQLRHKDASQVEMYKCGKCTFETKHRKSLQLHDLNHKDPSQVQTYKCGNCNFETKYRTSFRLHDLRHRDPSKVEMHECDGCDYKSIRKSYLTKHQLKWHRNPSEIKMFKCGECDYRSRGKYDIKIHQLKHKDY